MPESPHVVHGRAHVLDNQGIPGVEVGVLLGKGDVAIHVQFLIQGRGQGSDDEDFRPGLDLIQGTEKKTGDHRGRALVRSSDSEEDKYHRKREKRKDGKRSKSKERKRDKKREKKERKEKVKGKKKKDKGSVPHWGKYGIISDIESFSIFTKGQEFHTWLVEERKTNPETISKEQQKKEFSRFVEDYNTATLPHEKYYNMEAYERRMSALRQGEYLPPTDDIYDFNADLKAVSSSHKKKLTEQESYMSKEQLQELRRVQQERSEVGRMKLLGMDVKQNFGVRMDGTMFDG
ncbi:hypothetical protein JR316_0007170 [Psilocybe cubensis]|uniref:Uncharacterized protein n=1 Tax=Psilocybe cubensis TaxID=181762 RepID=A0ACB8GYL4_PSICU|nr:hypothetical protein JR316_0007170 [Psilocybe cubensis]KAH9480570.1 hypothetical protein JR316_0007170 [Psilocybe cubensis]